MNNRVRDAYNRIASDYAQQRDQFNTLPYIERLAGMLKPGASVLDVGCGAGLPISAYFDDHGFKVTGIDISSSMIDLARGNVPGASFEVRDMLDLKRHELHVDAIVSFYAVFHVNRERHQQLLETFRTLLPDSGLLLLTMGATDWEGTEPDFHGVEMSWSHYGPETNRQLLENAGFTVLMDEIDSSRGEQHQVLIGQAI